jgi:dinuclear metal center YbgI/SA1388 family protein
MAKRRLPSRKVKSSANPAKKTKTSIQDVLRGLEFKAPLRCSESWDNVGLLAGTAKSQIQSAVVCIDLTQKALDVAIAKGANLIVNHHPCIFPKSKGLSRVVDGGSNPSSNSSGSLVYQALRKGISVAAYHTNFDQCALEVVRTVSHGLGVEPQGRLMDHAEGSLSKLVVYVPTSHLDQVRTAIAEAGAGHLGNYDTCTFTSSGEGTFRGGKGSHPFLGKAGRLEKVKEFRLETAFPSGLEREIVKALMAAHPYEEVAYDIYPLKQPPSSLGLVRGLGYGFWGEYSRARPFSDVAKDVRKLFSVDGFWLTQPAPSRVKKIAFVAGKGASFTSAAIAEGCDLFITGEAGYHVTLDAKRRGMAVIELGHTESERFFLTTMEGWLAELGVKSYPVSDPTQKIWP